MKTEYLCHQGIIKSIDNQKITVIIERNSACSACHSKSLCMMSESKAEEIIITDADVGEYAVGEIVNVQLQKSSGNRAVVIAYLLPFAVLSGGLFITYFATHRELLSVLVSFLSIALYYFIIKLLKRRWEKAFHFSISKVDKSS